MMSANVVFHVFEHGSNSLKVFDTVDHQIFKKLHFYGIREKSFEIVSELSFEQKSIYRIC